MTTPRIGRCQHCAQFRPLFRHEGELEFWGYDPEDAAWICARDYNVREAAIENDRPFHINRHIQPFQAAADKATCESIARATERGSA